jgi:hypothetical protein
MPRQKKTWNPRREFDVLAATTDGGTVWIDYGDPRRVIVTRKGENPRDVAERNEKREQKKGDE